MKVILGRREEAALKNVRVRERELQSANERVGQLRSAIRTVQQNQAGPNFCVSLCTETQQPYRKKDDFVSKFQLVSRS